MGSLPHRPRVRIPDPAGIPRRLRGLPGGRHGLAAAALALVTEQVRTVYPDAASITCEALPNGMAFMLAAVDGSGCRICEGGVEQSIRDEHMSHRRECQCSRRRCTHDRGNLVSQAGAGGPFGRINISPDGVHEPMFYRGLSERMARGFNRPHGWQVMARPAARSNST